MTLKTFSTVSDFEYDQVAPKICEDMVVWEDNYYGDWGYLCR